MKIISSQLSEVQNVYNLLRCELFKLRKSKLFLLILGVVIAYSALTSVLRYSSIQYGGGSEAIQGIDMYFEQLSNYLLIAVAGSLIATTYICMDFDNKTIQDAIACGCSRSSIVLSKSLIYFFTIFITTVSISVASSVIISMAYGFGMEFSVASIFKLIAITLTTSFAYSACLSPCILLSFLSRKPVVVLAGGIFILFLGISFLKDAAQMEPAILTILSFTPYGINDALFTLDAAIGDFLKTIIVGIAFMLIILAVTHMSFRKSEVR